MKLTNRLAFITGGGRGIGRAIAFEFAREGASVAVAARTREHVEEVAKEVADDLGVQTLAIECDVESTANVNEAIDGFRAHFGRGPDIVVNNAGVGQTVSPVVQAYAGQAASLPDPIPIVHGLVTDAVIWIEGIPAPAESADPRR